MNKKLKVCAIIEARIGSERLPGKVLIQILGKSVLKHIVKRSNFCKYIDETILAIPNTKENDVLEKFALEKNYKIILSYNIISCSATATIDFQLRLISERIDSLSTFTLKWP